MAWRSSASAWILGSEAFWTTRAYSSAALGNAFPDMNALALASIAVSRSGESGKRSETSWNFAAALSMSPLASRQSAVKYVWGAPFGEPSSIAMASCGLPLR